MARDFGVKVVGLNEVDKMLKVLPKRTTNKIIPQALRFGAKPIIESAKAKVPSGIVFEFKDGKKSRSEELKKIKIFIKGKPGNKYAVIGPDARSISFFNLGIWIEFGTLAFRDKSLVRSRSAAAKVLADKGIGLIKHPFMRPAIDENRKLVRDRMEEKILLGIEKEVDKILKKGKV